MAFAKFWLGPGVGGLGGARAGVDGLWRLYCGVAVGGPFAGGRPVSSADGLYAVALWRGCRGASASAWGPFWQKKTLAPMPRPRLLLQRPPGEGGVGFP
jgi:hypothetical protein